MSSQNHKTAIKLPLAKLPDAKSSANFNTFESPLLKNVNKGNSFTDEIAVFHLKITLLSYGDIWCPSECKQTSTKQNCHPLIIRRKVMNSMEERTTVRNKKNQAGCLQILSQMYTSLLFKVADRIIVMLFYVIFLSRGFLKIVQHVITIETLQ